MKKIPLTQGKVAIVDDDDFERLNKYFWQYHNYGYATRKEPNPKGGQFVILMHREIMNPPEDMVVDHINHNSLDNRKKNLRIVSQSFNLRHSRKRKNNTSGYTGVTKEGKKWKAQTRVNNELIYLGCYDTPEEASGVYQNYMRELWEEAGYEFRPISEVCND